MPDNESEPGTGQIPIFIKNTLKLFFPQASRLSATIYCKVFAVDEQ